MTRVRLKFSKYGPIRFVGHLDVMRYFQKVMRRAGIDIAYSEGFSPHPLMSFAQPLSVGATSDGEYVDLTLRSFADLREAETDGQAQTDLGGAAAALPGRVNAVCHEGITVSDAEVLPEKAEKAMTAVAACSWRAAFREEYLPDGVTEDIMRDRLPALLACPAIMIRKKTKKGTAEKDIRPFIYRASFSERAFRLLLKSGSEDNVKPALFLGAFLRFLGADDGTLYLQGDELVPPALRLHREEIYTARADADGGYLEPLICRGAKSRIRLAGVPDDTRSMRGSI